MNLKGAIAYNSTGFWCLLGAISLGIHGAIAFILLQKIVSLEMVSPSDWVAVDMITLPKDPPSGTKPLLAKPTTIPQTTPTPNPATTPQTERPTTSTNPSTQITSSPPQPTAPPAPVPAPNPIAPTPSDNPTPTPKPTRSPTPASPPSPTPTPSPPASPPPSPKPTPPSPQPTPPASAPSPSPAPPAENNGSGAIATGLTVNFGRFELADPSRDIPTQLAKPSANQKQLAAIDYLLPLNLKLSSKLSLAVTLGIDEQGNVAEIYTVTVQQGELNPTEAKQLAQRILSPWLFEPSRMDGQPVFQSYRLILNIEPNF